MPTSLPKPCDSSRIRSTSASSPGTISAVPIATPPLAIAGRISFSPMSPSSRICFRKRQPAAAAHPPAIDELAPLACVRPWRRGRTRRFREPAARRFPQDRYRSAASRRARSNRMVSCGSQARCAPAATFRAIDKPRRPALRAVDFFRRRRRDRKARCRSPAAISMSKRSPPATPPAVLTNTADSPSASGEGKRTRSEPDSCSWRRRVTPSSEMNVETHRAPGPVGRESNRARGIGRHPPSERDPCRPRHKSFRAPSGD